MDTSRRSKKEETGRIKIGELVRLSGISKATIYHYMKMGLLEGPNKEGLGNRRFDQTHLKRLMKIRELRKKQKLTLSEIKAALLKQCPSSVDSRHKDNDGFAGQAVEKGEINREQEVTTKKKQILDAAIELFSKKGFANTTIDAIAQALNVGKGTIYHYFESKEDLFMECISRLTVIALPKESWDGIKREQDYFLRHRKRLVAFLTAFPSYSGILTMSRMALTGENRRLAVKAEETLFLMTKPIVDDFNMGQTSGVLRQFNRELVGYMVLAVGESLGSLLMMNSKYTLEEVIDAYFDFINYGTIRRGYESGPKGEPSPGIGAIFDLNGIKTRINSIQFGVHSFLSGKVGHAEVRIDQEKIKKIKFFHEPDTLLAEVTITRDESIKVEMDGDLLLSGPANYGTYSIQLKDIDSIVFNRY